MKIVRKEVKTFRVDVFCDRCDSAMVYNKLYLEQPQISQEKTPHVFLYTCTKCGHEEIVSQAYPYIEYEEVNVNLTKEIKKIFNDITQQKQD